MPKRPIRADDLLRMRFVSDPQISPDGTRVLFSVRETNEKNKTFSRLFLSELNGDTEPWTQGEAGASQGRWSPDGRAIAFVSSREEKRPQIFLISASGGEARRLTSFPEGSIGAFAWSPDGRWIACAFRETHPDWTEAAQKEREAKGLSLPPKIIETPIYRLDGDGYFLQQRYKLYLVDVSTGRHRLLYEGAADGGYSFAWAPHGRELAVAHNVSRTPWRDPENDQVFRVDLEGQAWLVEGLPKGRKGSVAWSPDGKWIAYLGDDSGDDPWGVRNTKAFVAPAEGGEARCLSREDDYCLSSAVLTDTRDAYGFSALQWSPDSAALYVSVAWQGAMNLAFIALDRARVEFLTRGRHVLMAGNASRDGRRFAATWGDATRLAEAAIVDLDDVEDGHARIRVLSNLNREFHEEVRVVEPEEHWVESADGTRVHTWLIKPYDYLPPKRYPAVLEIHGGPHAQYGWGFFHEFQLLAAEGYVVVYSNPRGSKGYGEAFCSAIRGNWGGPDWEDIQAVTRWMQHQPFIHPGQMGVMGGSYGGYMTNWVVGHTRDFKAAITDRCVSNLVSMAGSTDFPYREGYWEGRPWGDLETIATLWKQSPIAYFDRVETPMLVIHSEGDLRCNIEQAEQVFAALQQRGIESRFVRYPVTTSHGLSRGGPADLRIHRLNEIVSWWNRFLK